MLHFAGHVSRFRVLKFLIFCLGSIKKFPAFNLEGLKKNEFHYAKFTHMDEINVSTGGKKKSSTTIGIPFIQNISFLRVGKKIPCNFKELNSRHASNLSIVF